MLFLKLGGSLITDKTGVEVVREEVLVRVAAEIAAARAADPALRLVVGHGSGSFGHVAAAAERTREGVSTAVQWQAFAKVSDAAARLNRAVVGALLAAGLPAITLQPSASAACAAGEIINLAAGPVEQALAAGLLPVVYGDVAFDAGQGGTIISTEEILSFLAGQLNPSWLLLAGETAGVLNAQGTVVPRISPQDLAALRPALGGSRGTDVTGGMAGKVTDMLTLVVRNPALRVRIFSGLEPGLLTAVLLQPGRQTGTEVRADDV